MGALQKASTPALQLRCDRRGHHHQHCRRQHKQLRLLLTNSRKVGAAQTLHGRSIAAGLDVASGVGLQAGPTRQRLSSCSQEQESQHQQRQQCSHCLAAAAVHRPRPQLQAAAAASAHGDPPPPHSPPQVPPGSRHGMRRTPGWARWLCHMPLHHRFAQSASLQAMPALDRPETAGASPGSCTHQAAAAAQLRPRGHSRQLLSGGGGGGPRRTRVPEDGHINANHRGGFIRPRQGEVEGAGIAAAVHRDGRIGRQRPELGGHGCRGAGVPLGLDGAVGHVPQGSALHRGARARQSA